MIETIVTIPKAEVATAALAKGAAESMAENMNGLVYPTATEVFEGDSEYVVHVTAVCSCGKGDYCPEFGKMAKPFAGSLTVVATDADSASREAQRVLVERGYAPERAGVPQRTDAFSTRGSADPAKRAWLWKVAVR